MVKAASSNPSGCKKFKYSFGRDDVQPPYGFKYKVQINVLIVMISNYSLKTVIRHIPLWIIEAL